MHSCVSLMLICLEMSSFVKVDAGDRGMTTHAVVLSPLQRVI